jgi:hypothetical protein
VFTVFSALSKMKGQISPTSMLYLAHISLVQDSGSGLLLSVRVKQLNNVITATVLHTVNISKENRDDTGSQLVLAPGTTIHFY